MASVLVVGCEASIFITVCVLGGVSSVSNCSLLGSVYFHYIMCVWRRLWLQYW